MTATRRLLAIVCLWGLLLPAAHAALTPVNASGNGNGAERCLVGTSCPQGGYAGAASILRAYELDRGLAAGSLQRVDDASDRDWMRVSADAAVRPLARYAGDQSRLGVTSGSGVSLLTPVLQNFNVRVEHPGIFGADPRTGDFQQLPATWYGFAGTLGAPFAFVLHDLTVSLLLASNTALAGFSNSGYSQDWMVTWRVPGQDRYLIAWEDRRNIGGNGLPNDYDYNDYVLEVRGATPYAMSGEGEMPPVPLPLALGFMLAGLAVLGGAARRRATRP